MLKINFFGSLPLHEQCILKSNAWYLEAANLPDADFPGRMP